jgi:hypothetical protein
MPFPTTARPGAVAFASGGGDEALRARRLPTPLRGERGLDIKPLHPCLTRGN